MAEVSVGSTIPDIPVYYLPPTVGDVCVYAPSKININELEHPTVVVVVPGAFTPTCSEIHVPGFLTTSAIGHLKDAGVKNLLILSTDSPFITRAWGENLSSGKKEILKELQDGYIKFVSDASAELLTKLGLVGEPNDLFAKYGLRGLRSALIIDSSGKVKYVGVEKVKGAVSDSGIEAVLDALKK